MKDFLSKNWLKLAVCLTVVGAALFAAGMGLGAYGGSVVIDENGLHVSAAGDSLTLSEHGLADFHEVEIVMDGTAIEFIPSDHYGVEMRLRPENAPAFGVENGRLTVREPSKDFKISLAVFEFTNPHYIKVYYPEGADFGAVACETSSGGVTLPKTAVRELSIKTVSGPIRAEASGCENVSLNANSGSIFFEGTGDDEGGGGTRVQARTVSGRIDATVGGCGEISLRSNAGSIRLSGDAKTEAEVQLATVSGGISADGLVWSALTAESNSGRIHIAGEPRGPSRAKTVAGRVDFTLKAAASRVAYDLSSISGSIVVGGQRMGSPARSWNAAGDAAASATGDAAESLPGGLVSVGTNSGGIRLDFVE